MAKEQLNKSSLKAAKFPELEKELINYINDMESRNTAIGEELTMSNGWIHNFLKRHELKQRSMNGESGSLTMTDQIIEKTTEIRNILKDYDLKDIYNMDETGLYYRQAPTKTISRNPVPGKRTGSELGFSYYHTNKAWMTKDVFRSVMHDFNKKMYRERRKVVLLLYNAPVHEQCDEFSNVKLVFLPANTTSKLQPLDAGVIAAFKRNYRTTQYKHVAIKHSVEVRREKEKQREMSLRENQQDNDAQNIDNEVVEKMKKLISDFHVSQLHAMQWIKAAWEKVSADAIKNCWLHTGILPETLIENMAIATENALIVYDDDISLEMREDIEVAVREEEENKGIFDNDTTALIHDGSDDEVEDMEEADDVIPVNEEKILASLGYVNSNFVATNDKNFKTLKDMADLYLRYKKTVIESRCNQSTLDGFFSKN
ncbi:hypothetical protein INT46_011083 [Mucor plumbeus]|uniref:DDE-1 domain-containing protein n=1 Tax=Mucor plumbeus TaxID=97098 RepID=A0A8H7UTE7_9FUNG|nr:hypothetical protein INT46_011083 [Mucor plumbeus]